MAATPQPPPAPVFAQLVFFFLIAIPFVVLVARMAKRKGRSPWISLWCVMPGVNAFIAIWVASLPDAALLKKIEELKKRLESSRS